MLAALLALSGPALASGPEVWAALYNGRLIDAADRDHGAAIAVYETLLEDLGPEDPLRGQLLLSLGRAQRDAGRHEEAWWSLLAAAGQGQPAVRADARRVLAAMQLRAQAVTALPLTVDFSDSVAPFVRGWARGELDDLRVREEGGGALAWQVDVAAADDDFLRLELAPPAGPVEQVAMRLHADRFDAQVRVMVEDTQGQRWTAPVLSVPTAGWVSVAYAAEDFAPADAPAALRRPDPAEIRAVELRDVTGFHSTSRGENVVLVDDLVLR